MTIITFSGLLLIIISEDRIPYIIACAVFSTIIVAEDRDVGLELKSQQPGSSNSQSSFSNGVQRNRRPIDSLSFKNWWHLLARHTSAVEPNETIRTALKI